MLFGGCKTLSECDADVERSDLKTVHGGSRDALADSSRMSSCTDIQPPLEVRVYRRSMETLAMLDDRRRAQSLPRGMELNRSVGSDLQTSATSTVNSRRGSVSATGHSSRTTSRKASARSSVASISGFKGETRLSASSSPCPFIDKLTKRNI